MTQLVNPAVSCKAAFNFYATITCVSYMSILHAASDRAKAVTRPFRILYRHMADAELPRWKAYLAQRVSAKGWDGERLLRGLPRLPRSLPQAQRWFLFKMHLNAPMTTVRLAAAGIESENMKLV